MTTTRRTQPLTSGDPEAKQQPMSNPNLALPRAAALLILLVAWGPLGCPKKSTDAAGSAAGAAADEPTEDVDPSKLMSMPEVVFDPRNPPPGFTKCHRNHCHRVGGGVASYAQVMEEIGATKIIGVPKPKPMPPAPAHVKDDNGPLLQYACAKHLLQ